MALTYNSNSSYDNPSLTYEGNIGIFIPGIANQVQIGELFVRLVSNSDDSNSTIIGIATLDFAPTGEIQFARISTGPMASITGMISTGPMASVTGMISTGPIASVTGMISTVPIASVAIEYA